MGWSKDLRCLAYATAQSNEAFAIPARVNIIMSMTIIMMIGLIDYSGVVGEVELSVPRAWAATPMRPPSRVDMAMANPLPGAPSMSSLGTLQSSKDTVAVEEPLMPVVYMA